MVGLEGLALGAAPLVGGVLLGGMADKGRPSGPDLRAVIKSELDLLERIPEDQVTRRAAFEQVIAEQVGHRIRRVRLPGHPRRFGRATCRAARAAGVPLLSAPLSPEAHRCARRRHSSSQTVASAGWRRAGAVARRWRGGRRRWARGAGRGAMNCNEWVAHHRG
jgi:hypothetical protein